MTKESAGLLLYRERNEAPEVLLVHPGGPFWVHRDEAAWSIPKGEIDPGERPVDVARREFAEELGSPAPEGEWLPLGTIRQAGGKLVHGWAARGDFDPDDLRSMMFEVEWPPRSGSRQSFPEVDRAAWFDLTRARRSILVGQRPFVDRLEELLTKSD